MNIFESTTAYDNTASASTDSQHRPIELQSPPDLFHLQNLLTQHVQAKLDTHFPPNPSTQDLSETDPLRAKVQAHLETYQTNIYTLAKPSLRINGLEGEEMETSLRQGEEVEAFDSKLALRIQGLASEVEALRTLLALKRRAKPASAPSLLKEEEAGEEKRDEEEEEGGEDKEDVKIDMPVPRLQDVRENFERGVRVLEGVKGGIGGSVERLERARRTVGVIEGGQQGNA